MYFGVKSTIYVIVFLLIAGINLLAPM